MLTYFNLNLGSQHTNPIPVHAGGSINTYSYYIILAILLIGITMMLSIPVTAAEQEDKAIYCRAQSADDKRNIYRKKLLKAALEITTKKYGPYQFKTFGLTVSRKRLYRLMSSGDDLNICASAASMETEKHLLTIHIPISRGLGGYRLLLIHKRDAALFRDVGIKDLKSLSAGLASHWSITAVMEEQGFVVTKTHGYEALFKMLDKGRFKYFSRRVTEIYSEMALRQEKLPNVMIEPTLLIHLPLPTYFYVSPNKPRLAARVEEGLKMMIENGDFEKLFYAVYDDIINRVQFNKRRIIYLDNHLLSDQTPLDRADLWFTPDTQ